MKVNKTIVAAVAAITLAGGTAAIAAATANTVAPQATNVSQAVEETPEKSDAAQLQFISLNNPQQHGVTLYCSHVLYHVVCQLLPGPAADKSPD